MSQKAYNIISVIVIILLLAGVIYFAEKNKSVTINTIQATATTTPVVLKIEYKNASYGFSISLPQGWKGYSVIKDEWEGSSALPSGEGQTVTETGPLLSVRHSEWEYKAPRQDIPVLVFTIAQWNKLQEDKFHIGASPIGPSELGRNTKYVFALPGRYNYGFPEGYEEVDQIIQSGAFKAS